MVSGIIKGSTLSSDRGSFLRNIGDGAKVEWASFDDRSIAEYSLSLSKLMLAQAGSILVANNQGVFQAQPPSVSDQVLTVNFDGIPDWNKLTGNNISPDNLITGDKVQLGSITNANLPSYLIGTRLLDSYLTATNFQSASITAQKLELGSDSTGLTIDKLTSDVQRDFPTRVWSNIIPDNFINVSNLSIIFGSITQEELLRIVDTSQPFSASKFNLPDPITVPHLSFVDFRQGDLLNGSHIQFNSIPGWYFFPSDSEKKFSIDMIEDGSIQLEHFNTSYQELFQEIRSAGLS